MSSSDGASERAADLGTLLSWTRDAALGAALMAGGALCPLLFEKLDRVGPEPFDLWVTGVTMGFGALVGAALSPLLWLFARLTWRISPLVSMASGPVAGALAAGFMFAAVFTAIEGNIPHLSASQAALVLGLGALSLAPPWVAYVAVRARGRSGIGVAIGAGGWAVLPMVLLMVGSKWFGWI